MLLFFQYVQLKFTSVTLENRFDFVRIYDGADNSSRLISAMTGSLITQCSLYSSQQYMYIRFTTDSSITDRGFYAEFETTTGKQFISSQIVLQSETLTCKRQYGALLTKNQRI